jgi:hypothetical protein
VKRLLFAVILGYSFLISLDRTVSAKEGFYLGLNIPYTTVGGDFDGSSSLTGTQEAIAIPVIKGAFGVGMVAGLGIGESFEIGLNVSDTVHNVEWLGAHGDGEQRSLGVLFKYSFLTTETIQPFLTSGITYNELILKDAAVDLSGSTGDATLTGWGIDFGIGADHYFSPHISVGGTVVYHLVEYNYAKGIQESGGIDNDVNGSGLGVIFSAAYHF